MEPIKAFIQKWRDKLAYMEFSDLFPQNKKCDVRDIRSVIFFIGIYLVALIFCALFFVRSPLDILLFSDNPNKRMRIQ